MLFDLAQNLSVHLGPGVGPAGNLPYWGRCRWRSAGKQGQGACPRGDFNVAVAVGGRGARGRPAPYPGCGWSRDRRGWCGLLLGSGRRRRRLCHCQCRGSTQRRWPERQEAKEPRTTRELFHVGLFGGRHAGPSAFWFGPADGRRFVFPLLGSQGGRDAAGRVRDCRGVGCRVACRSGRRGGGNRPPPCPCS